jgi:hypothetical protein
VHVDPAYFSRDMIKHFSDYHYPDQQIGLNGPLLPASTCGALKWAQLHGKCQHKRRACGVDAPVILVCHMSGMFQRIWNSWH